MMRNLSIYAAAAALAASFTVRGDSLALDDREGVFGGASGPAHAAMAYQNFCLDPESPVCLHGSDDFQDFKPSFSPVVFGVGVWPSVLSGFTLNTNGTLRLSLGADGSAEGTVVVGAPPLLWGDRRASASIHRCIGGVQEMCFACGRRHSLDTGYDCSHDSECHARTSAESGCTCRPILLRTNWDDDNMDGSEDRLATFPSLIDDDIADFRAVGIEKGCCCYLSLSAPVYVHGLSASAGLRLWSWTMPAGSSSSAFGIEAVLPSSAIGGHTLSYEIRDATNGLVRSVVRHLTAANVEIRPDFDDDGTVDSSDSLLLAYGEPWQIRVRDEPYLLSLVSEGPYNASASLLEFGASGTPPAIRTSAAGGAELLPGAATNSAAFVTPNGTRNLYVDASGGPGSALLMYSLGFGEVHEPLADTRLIRAVDANVREKWETTNSIVSLTYDFSDVSGDVYWTIYDEYDNAVAWGLGGTFAPGALAPGNYLVEVFFADVYDGGSPGYTSSAELHVVTIEHSLLWETGNRANRVFNPTPKDDETAPERQETDGEFRYAAPRNVLYVVEDAFSGSFNITESVRVFPADFMGKVLCAVYTNGVYVVGCSTNVNASGEAELRIPAPSEAVAAEYEIRAGIDLNEDGVLSFSESMPLDVYEYNGQPRRATVKGISGAKYNSHRQSVDWMHETGDNPPQVLLPMARSFLSLFYKNSDEFLNQTLKPDITETVMLNPFAVGVGFAEWLTHNCGAEFNANDTATITRYVWTPASHVSQCMAEMPPIAPKVQHFQTYTQVDPDTSEWQQAMNTYSVVTETGSMLLSYYETNLQHVAEMALSCSGDGETWSFPSDSGWVSSEQIGVLKSESPTSWVERATVTLGDKGNYGGIYGVLGAIASMAVTGGDEYGEYDTYNAIGRARIKDAKYRFIVTKRTHLLLPASYDLSVAFSCKIQDLYDFNYEDGGPAGDAAALQIGVVGAGNQDDSRRNCGRVYCHEIQIETLYRNLNN